MSVADPERIIHDVGNGMLLYRADLATLKRQTINARMMPLNEYNTLVGNIARRGELESTPYCVQTDSAIEIVSGHHRVAAALDADITEAIVLLDTQSTTRSEIVAKQLAHNRIAGFDDPDMLKQLYDMLEEPEHQLESGLSAEMHEIDSAELDKMDALNVKLDWRTITFCFLPTQLEDLQAVIDSMPDSDHVLVAHIGIYDEFTEALRKYKKAANIQRADNALHAIIKRITQEIELTTDSASIDYGDDPNDDPFNIKEHKSD